MKSFGLYIRNNAPTRVTATSASCIDHIFKTMDLDVHTLESNISDRYSLLIDTKMTFRKKDRDTEILTRNLIALQKAETIY